MGLEKEDKANVVFLKNGATLYYRISGLARPHILG